MSAQITTNNLVSSQGIELKAPQNLVPENVEVKVSDYNLSGQKVTSAAESESESESVKLSNADNKTINDLSASTSNSKESASELEEAIEVVADFMQLSTQNVNFQKDEASDKTIIKVFDTESKDLIKQFPSEEVIDIANKILALRQDIGMKTGILLDEQV